MKLYRSEPIQEKVLHFQIYVLLICVVQQYYTFFSFILLKHCEIYRVCNSCASNCESIYVTTIISLTALTYGTKYNIF